jgi:hypothetical protein
MGGSTHVVSARGGPDATLLAEDDGLGDLSSTNQVVVDVS